jgi:hypothetical protein
MVGRNRSSDSRICEPWAANSEPVSPSLRSLITYHRSLDPQSPVDHAGALTARACGGVAVLSREANHSPRIAQPR